jgi:hypothetical protein
LITDMLRFPSLLSGRHHGFCPLPGVPCGFTAKIGNAWVSFKKSSKKFPARFRKPDLRS